MPTPNIAIIGGGYAGISAAITLAEAGLTCQLFEANHTLGGRARRVVITNKILDNGQHLLLGAYRETIRLINLVNKHSSTPTLGSDLTPLPSLLHTIPLTVANTQGIQLQLPSAHSLFPSLSSLAKLSLTPALSWSSKLRLLALLANIRRQQFVVRPHLTVSELLYQQTSEAIQLFWEPLCLSALNTPCHQACAQVFVNVLRDSFFCEVGDSQFLLPRVDLTQLFPEPAQDWLSAHNTKIHTAEAIRKITRQPNGWSLQSSRNRTLYQASHLIVATTPWQAKLLLSEVEGLSALVAKLGQITYQPILTYYRASKHPLPLPAPIIQLFGTPGHWLIDRTTFVKPLTDNLLVQHAIVVSSPNLQGLSRSDWMTRIEEQLRTNFPDNWTLPIEQQLIIEKRATHSCVSTHPNFSKLIALPHLNLYLAGDYTYHDYPATLEAAVRSGVRAAKSLIN